MSPGSRGLYTKKYGQVLLRNPRVANFEVEALKLPPGSKVLEIGPGKGFLTGILLAKGFLVEAIEPDHRFAEELSAIFSQYVQSGALTIKKASFLEISGGDYDGIIGNVPYHISSQIVFHLGNFTFRRAILMLQREFCVRLAAGKGSADYSRLSVNAQLRFHVRIIARVSRNSFSPVPDVDSAVVELMPRGAYSEDQVLKADGVFRVLFSNRRKKLSSSIRGLPEEIGNKRVSDLSPEELMEIASLKRSG